MTGKMILKRIASQLMSLSGIHSLAERICCSGQAFVLMYHRILPLGGNQQHLIQPGMFVTPPTFEKHVAFLKGRFKVIFLEELAEKIIKGEHLGGYCALTFDDGWRDNFTDAFPILKKYNVPATIFLTTGYVGTDRMFWPEELCSYLERMLADTVVSDSAPRSYRHFSAAISRYQPCSRATFFDRSIEILKGYAPDERAEILGFYRSLFKVPGPVSRQMLSWDEAREMLASEVVRFGAHTVNHEILDQLSCQAAQDEIRASGTEIERHLGTKVTTFAYPNGNHNDSIRTILAENGFNVAVTTCKGLIGRSRSLLEIPRIALHDDVSNTIALFRSRILFSGF